MSNNDSNSDLKGFDKETSEALSQASKARASDNPLNMHPIKPVHNSNGRLVNPIGKNHIQLGDKRPLQYKNLEPSTAYRSSTAYRYGDIEYLTDDQGVTARVRGRLREIKKPIRHPYAQKQVGKALKHTGSTLHGGHIVAVTLGGFASGPNLILQDANCNVSVYRKLENTWKEMLSYGTVEIDIAMTQDENTNAPLSTPILVIKFWHNGYEYETAILNEPHAQ